MRYPSPLRYPGGKRVIANFMKAIVRKNGLHDCYAEPYAGGASVALSLLYDDLVSRIIINDLDRSLYCFWKMAVGRTEELCNAIDSVPITVEEWERQRAVQDARDPDPLELALSTFFLNRTNRSGIVWNGGIIGGKDQMGRWKIDARFNKKDLISRIETIGQHADRILVTNTDALGLLENYYSVVTADSLVYLDPPYYRKGRELYLNSYDDADHTRVAACVRTITGPWIVSYDNHPFIRDLYDGCRSMVYSLSYSARTRHEGQEVIFFSDGLAVPPVSSPAYVSLAEVQELLT